eukprot:SAG22_NODE_438_length_10500_cov_13.037496_4_plen_67_part_00
MNPQYDVSYDSDRPTCKVVKRAGQKGARIFPKGCKNRTVADQHGEITDRFTPEGARHPNSYNMTYI